MHPGVQKPKPEILADFSEQRIYHTVKNSLNNKEKHRPIIFKTRLPPSQERSLSLEASGSQVVTLE